jgi:heme/copper-type cytochrome/quinol oxidase subunit 2
MRGSVAPNGFRSNPFWAWVVAAVLATGCCNDDRTGSDANLPAISDSTKSALELPETGEPYEIEVTVSKDCWRVRYPGVDGHIETEADPLVVRSIHVPLGAKIVFVLKSIDYVYTFSLPHYGLKEIAVPSLEFKMELRPAEAGKFALVGKQLCGDPHDLQGHLVVEPADRFLTWLASARSGRSDSRQ